MPCILFLILPLSLSLHLSPLLLLFLSLSLLLLLLLLTIYMGLPHSVAAMTPSCRNRAKPKSAIFSLKLYDLQLKNCKQIARILRNSFSYFCQ